MNPIKIAINGFGRIGRSFFREAFGKADFNIIAINDVTDTKTLAYLLKYDSIHGRYDKEVSIDETNLIVDGKKVNVFAEKDPAHLLWKELGVDLVIESTGFFTSYDKAKAHLDAGAKRVVITAPAQGDVATLIVGVNDGDFENAGPITSNASCTTNSVAPVMAIMLEKFGIKKANMATVHGYTAAQKLVDGPDGKDIRRGRAAAVNIVPSTTGAAEAVIQSIPRLKGKFDAMSVRVPTITGSLSIMNIVCGREISSEEINDAFRSAAKEARWQKTITIVEDPIVSTDIIGEPYGAIVDLTLTKVTDGDFAQVFSWYDNEAGYTATLEEHVRMVAKL